MTRRLRFGYHLGQDKYVYDFNVISPEKVEAILANSYGHSTTHAADAYFGPGAWVSIFGDGAYSDNPSKAEVVERIRTIAKRAYGVKS